MCTPGFTIVQSPKLWSPARTHWPYYCILSMH